MTKLIDNLPTTPLEIQELLEEMRQLFIKEPNLIKIPKGPCIFIGDTHGDLGASKEIIKKFVDNQDLTLIFLGDYVDRGANQLENVLYLLLLKREFPNRIILLRGNHEEQEMNWSYGFANLLDQKFAENATEVFNHFQETFAQLPLCVLTWNRIFGVHGGIPISMDKLAITLKQISQIKRGLINLNEFDSLTAQLLWNDPKENVSEAMPSSRGIGYYFGKKPFLEFSQENEIQLVIRSHEVFQEGYKYFFNNKLISIFSALDYVYLHGIHAKIMRIEANGDLKLMNIKD